MPALKTLAAFWQADQSDGLALAYAEDDADLVLELVEDGVTALRQSADVEEAMRSLQHYAQTPVPMASAAHGRQMREEDAVAAITAIAYLEEVGAIPSDEFNGLLKIWEA